MGQTLKILAKQELPGKPVFNNRFVVEVCETIHVHYRNLRINLRLPDFIKFAEGMKNAFERWIKRGQPQCSKQNHIELTRKQIALEDIDDTVQINLNKNLYKTVKGRIFSEGADIEDQEYIHLKIRDLRIELSIEEFKVIANAFEKANKAVKDSSIGSELQKT